MKEFLDHLPTIIISGLYTTPAPPITEEITFTPTTRTTNEEPALYHKNSNYQ